MKKGIITTGILAILACAMTAYCWAAERENSLKETTEKVSEKQIESIANAQWKSVGGLLLRSGDGRRGRFIGSEPHTFRWKGNGKHAIYRCHYQRSHG